MAMPLMYILAALDALSFSMVLPILSLHMTSLGGTRFQLGILGSLGAFICLIWNPLCGSLSDTNGRKTMLLFSIGICFFSNLVLANTSSFVIACCARLACSFGCQNMGILKTLVSDSIKSVKDQSLYLNKMNALMGICFILGSLFGGHLSQEKNGASSVYGIICLINATSFVLVLLLPEETRKVPKENVQHSSIPAMVKNELIKAVTNVKNIDWSTCKDIFKLKLCLEIAYGMWQANVSYLLLEVFGASSKTLGGIIAGLSVLGIVTNLLVVKFKNIIFAKDLSGHYRLLLGKSLLLVTFTMIAFTKDFNSYVLCLVPLGLARSMLENTMNEILLTRVSSESKGAIMGAFDSLLSLAGLFTPIVAALVAQIVGIQTSSLVSAVPVLLEMFVVGKL